MAAVLLSRGAEKDVAEADGSLKTAIAKRITKLHFSPHLRG